MTDFKTELDEALYKYAQDKDGNKNPDVVSFHSYQAGANWALTSNMVKRLVKALKSFEWQDAEYDDDIMTDGSVAREAIAEYHKALEDYASELR